MRRISQGGAAKLIAGAVVGYIVLYQCTVVSAERRLALPPKVSYASPYAAPTPQRPTSKKPPIDANATFVAKVKPGSFALVLNDGNRYIWTPTVGQKLPLKTAFASVEVPLALVASLTFSDEQGAVKVAFRNGDIVTGKLLLKELAIRTAYGDLTVPISAMTFLGAGGVTKVAATTTPQPNTAGPRYSSSIALPPRPAPTVRIDRLRR